MRDLSDAGWNALPLSYGTFVVSEVIQIGVICHRTRIAQVPTNLIAQALKLKYCTWKIE